MISAQRLLDLASPVTVILPEYHVEQADINEALGHGVANCAARAYAGGLILRHSYPNQDLYAIEFGFAPEHGGEHLGKNGVHTLMGHAAVRFSVHGSTPMVLESYKNSMLEVVSLSEEHEGYIWMDLDEGYRTYLERANVGDIEIDPDNILGGILARIEVEAA